MLGLWPRKMFHVERFLFLLLTSLVFAEADVQGNNTVTVVEERPATPGENEAIEWEKPKNIHAQRCST